MTTKTQPKLFSHWIEIVYIYMDQTITQRPIKNHIFIPKERPFNPNNLSIVMGNFLLPPSTFRDCPPCPLPSLLLLVIV